jgi:hypothetical protein
MSHITFKMCSFVLIIYLRDYHYDFDLDIVVLWSCYGVLRLTYTTYQNLCPTHHFFGQLLMSQDTSPTWIVLLESIYIGLSRYFFAFSPCFKMVLRFDSLCLEQLRRLKTNGERKNVRSIFLILKPKYVEDLTLYSPIKK